MSRCFTARLPILVGAGLAIAVPAAAGPPYLTDDPEPTDPGHWEIYNYVIGLNGPGLAGEAGFDINYGGAKNLQLTMVLPLALQNANGVFDRGLQGGTGVIELAAKYKFLHQSDDSWLPDVSFFPRAFVPTNDRFGSSRVNLWLPFWGEKDLGPWSVFGGGGYQINPGPGQASFWQGGLALSRAFGKRFSFGGEVYAQTRDSVAGGGYTATDLAATYRLTAHWTLMGSAGPAWLEGGGHGQVFYFALKADY
jgi:hypothetical protein